MGNGTEDVTALDTPQGPGIQQGAQQNIYTAANGALAGYDPTPYQGQRTAGFGDVSQWAMNQALGRSQGAAHEQALGGYIQGALGQGQFDLTGAGLTANGAMAGLRPAQEQLGATAGGQYLGQNPYLNAMYGQAANQMTEQFRNSVMPGIDAKFGAGGRAGSGMHAAYMQQANNNLGNQLGGLAANMYGNAYNTERDRMVGAAGTLQSGALSGMSGLGDLYGRVSADQGQAGQLSGQLSGQEWNNISRGLGVGGMVDAKAQDYIDDDRELYGESQNAAFNALRQYSDAINSTNNAPTGMPQRRRSAWETVLGFLGGGAQAAIGGLVQR